MGCGVGWGGVGITVSALYGVTLLSLHARIWNAEVRSIPCLIMTGLLSIMAGSVAMAWLQSSSLLKHASNNNNNNNKKDPVSDSSSLSLDTVALVGCAWLLPLTLMSVFPLKQLLSNWMMFPLTNEVQQYSACCKSMPGPHD
jgi:hypothetical protein